MTQPERSNSELPALFVCERCGGRISSALPAIFHQDQTGHPIEELTPEEAEAVRKAWERGARGLPSGRSELNR